jgi:predicted transcriptional regulator
MPKSVERYLNILKESNGAEAVEITDKGKNILKYMQDNKDAFEYFKAKDIADGLGVSGRVISGSMRKLVSNNFVEKMGENPIVYIITEKGLNYKID